MTRVLRASVASWCHEYLSIMRSHAAGWMNGHYRAQSTVADTFIVTPGKIRDFAIIAHIDHGKTTLMDRLLAQCGSSVTEDRVMDSNTLEKERGITILAKYTSFMFKGHLINAVDTPGHADFGGEVERVLGMVDGAVLLVDASEGPLAQTKFVLEKALRKGLCPVVLLNKVDRDSATAERCGQAASAVFDLFASLGATDRQLDFPMLYASAKQGWASRTLPPPGQAPPNASMEPLLDAILSHVPPPAADPESPFALCVAMIERDHYLGRVVTGRVASGRARVGDAMKVLAGDGSNREAGKITRIMKRTGTEKVSLVEAVAGDIVSLTGCEAAGISDTIAAPSVTEPLDPGHVDPPTLSMVFGPNDSPLSGREGKAVTGRAIGEWLMAEAETSVSLKVLPVPEAAERYEVQARGELQLGVLLENLRRQGFELAVSPPQVLVKEVDGQRLEPIEEVTCEVQEALMGNMVELMSARRGELLEVVPAPGGRQRLSFTVPSRGMLGFRAIFVSMTRGEGLLQRAFLRYAPYRGQLEGVRKGVLVSMADGKTSSFAIGTLQDRGVFFVQPGEDVYSGMIVGEHSREQDLEVNPAKGKKMTNVRSTEADEKVFLAAPRQLTLEDAIGYVAADELIEVTPKSIRLRKRILDANVRKSSSRRAAKDDAR